MLDWIFEETDMLEVRFLVLKDNVYVTRKFDSAFECRKFIMKLRRSSKCRLVSYPHEVFR